MNSQQADELASEIVSSCILDPGESILAVHAGPAAVLLETIYRGLRFEVARAATSDGPGSGYALYTVRESATDGRARPEGIAQLPGGERYHLNDPEGFRAFFAAARTLIEPLDFASLLATFQSEAPVAERVIAAYGDLAWLFPGANLAASLHLSLPVIEGTPEAAFQMRFCTLYLDRDPRDRFTKVNLNRWRVAATAEGVLSWAVEPLARNLDSPVFRPQG